MKKLILIILAALLTTVTFAQETKNTQESAEPVFTNHKDFRSRVFTIQHRSPRVLLSSLQLLTSGQKGAGMNVNEEMRTLTVRDFPENIAAVEEALKRLDVPATSDPEITFRVHVLIGSATPSTASSVPDELLPVVRQLQSTLRYASYGLLTAAVHSTRPGVGIESSGVAEAKLLGITTTDAKPVFYDYNLRQITVQKGERIVTDVANLRFKLRLPLTVNGATNYQDVGFETPVKIRDGEKVVVGTTTMGDKALVVVVSASVN